MKFPALILLFLTLTANTQAATDPKLKARFDSAMKQFESRDEEATVKLSIIDVDGSTKSREILVQRAGNKQEQRMIARIQSPSDLKGTSLLSVMNKTSENQWLYLPSSKQTRKIVTGDNKEGGILGSELRYEDFNPSVIRRSEISFVRKESRDGRTYDVLQAQPPTGSQYDKAHVWIQNGSELPVQIEYFQKNERVKSIIFSDYRSVGKVLRPHKIAIRNLKNKRGTEIEMGNYKVNKGLSMRRLTVESLAKTW